MVLNTSTTLRRLVFSATLLTLSSASHAASLETLGALSQDQFKTLVENLVAVTHYRGVTPAEPLGIIGFDIGVGLTATQLDDELFDLASDGGVDINNSILPRASVHKGLPLGIDIGASVGAIPGTDIKVLGAEIRYAILEGNVALPALGVRASYSLLQGEDDIAINNAGLDVSISKGFLVVTPYAGAGVVRGSAALTNVDELDDEDVNLTKLFVGLNLNFGFNVTLEADRTGDYTSYSAKAGIRF